MLMVNQLIGFGAFDAGVVLPVTSYANTGGTGDRTAIITATTTVTFDGGNINDLIDGSQGDDADTNGAAVSGLYVRFDFGTAKYIDAHKFYCNGTQSGGTWKWQGSNDAVSWTDIGTSFTLDMSVAGTESTALAAGTNLWRYYQLLGVSGVSNGGGFWREIEFKIG